MSRFYSLLSTYYLQQQHINPCTQPKLYCQSIRIHNEELKGYATNRYIASTWGDPGHRQQLWFPQCAPYTAKQCSAGVGHSK